MIGKIIVAVIAILVGLIIYRQVSDRAMRANRRSARKSPPKTIEGKAETLIWDEKTQSYRTSK